MFKKIRYFLITTLIFCTGTALALPQINSVDRLDLKIINNSRQSIVFSKNLNLHNSHSFDLGLGTYRLKPGQSTRFVARALVAPGYLNGLGATLYLHTKTARQPISFIIADSALGYNLTPVIGLATNNPDQLQSQLSHVSIKADAKSYDLSVANGTVTITG